MKGAKALAREAIQRVNRFMWSPAAPEALSVAGLRTFGASWGAALGDARSPLELAWADQAMVAGQAFDPVRLKRLVGLGARPYAVIGDSHSQLLVRRSRQADGQWLAPLWWLETGASARGLGRPDARSGAGARVCLALRKALDMPDTVILLKFGQVDVEFVQVFKRLEAGRTVFDLVDFHAFAEELVGRYVAFVADAVPPQDRARVRLCSLFPPALSDAAWRGGYVNAHIAQVHGPMDGADLSSRLAGLEMPDLAARTALHAHVNAALAEAAAAEGFTSYDDFALFLGAGDVVDPVYLGEAAGADHHLDFHATRAQVSEMLWRTVGRSAFRKSAK